jgi:hypothetical protein
MGVVSDISSVIGLATKAVELADQLKNLDLKAIIVDLKGKLIDLKEEIIQLREENVRLTERVKQAPMALAAPKEKPMLKDGLYYNGDDGPFCTACYDTSEKLVRVTNATHDERVVMGIRCKCPVCKAMYAH